MDLTACDNRLCASIHFSSSTWVTLSDGTGRLYLIKSGKRGNSASEKWEVSCAITYLRIEHLPNNSYSCISYENCTYVM